MGLRAASVRPPNVVVMAPALTEAGQSQNFPSSPINSVNNGDYVSRESEAKEVKCAYFTPKKNASSLHQLNIIMSACPTMGPRDRIPNDMEQLLNNLTNEDITPQELMQVFKTIESADDHDHPQSESEVIFPALFSEVDMMKICDDESFAYAKEARAKEFLDELHKKQLKLERRSEFLLRRIRKVQARVMGQHVSSEIAGLFEHIHQIIHRRTSGTPPQPAPLQSVPPQPVPPQPAVPPQPIGPRSISSLVRKLHLSTIQQSTLSTRQKFPAKYFGSGSSEAVPTVRSPASGALCVPRLEPEARDDLERVSGALHTEVAMLEHQVDSDATASSSGAESCDEMQTYNNPHQHFLSISKRAAWRYANERAAVAARWTWLQAQISDLEYRIRQHNELHRQIRAGKGFVIIGEASTSTSTTSSPTAVNGYRGQLPGGTPTKEEPLANGAVGANSGGSARTRPLHKESFRKRKLLQTTGLHTVSKKANRASNIRCGCVPPTVPCALCTGRTDPTFPRDTPDQMTVPERIALLDPAYHPVLSFPDDISQSIHLEAIMKLSEWQQKSLRCNLSKSMKSLAKNERLEKNILDNRPKKTEHRKKFNRLLKNELKSKINRRRGISSTSANVVRVHRKRRSLAMAQLHALGSESTDELEALEAGAAVASGSGESLTPSPLSHVTVMPYRRNRVDSYDIDNIVIPYSVAAATRVEKLQYKEILTPKWRVIDHDFPAKYDVKNNGIVRRISEDSDVEDMSEENLITRHERCEHEEKKKFLSYIKFPLSVGRGRANRRTDSRAESSGANTPDPMSPAADIDPSLITSPPATPLANHDESNLPAQTQFRPPLTSYDDLPHQFRRRTISSQRGPTPEPAEIVAPFEPREFPLSDEVFEAMLKVMPEGHAMPVFCKQDSEREESLPPTRVATPVESDSTESALAEEDPNDPEWECRRS